MELNPAVEKSIILTTRDFYAESWERDGTRFQITRRGDGEDKVSSWWEAHRFDNHRKVFAPEDECDIHLSCHDETEALAIVLSLQQEYNAVAL